MKHARAFTVLVALAIPAPAYAQVLTIGETLGRGKSAILLSDNVIYPGDDIPSLNIAYAMWARGPHQRFDVFVSGGETTTEGETQAFVGGGGNLLNLLLHFRSLFHQFADARHS